MHLISITWYLALPLLIIFNMTNTLKSLYRNNFSKIILDCLRNDLFFFFLLSFFILAYFQQQKAFNRKTQLPKRMCETYFERQGLPFAQHLPKL